jgi:hypothetical protein
VHSTPKSKVLYVSKKFYSNQFDYVYSVSICESSKVVFIVNQFGYVSESESSVFILPVDKKGPYSTTEIPGLHLNIFYEN